MIQRELMHEEIENTLPTYIKKINIVPLDEFANIMPLMPANTIIDIFDNSLCIYVHFQHCF